MKPGELGHITSAFSRPFRQERLRKRGAARILAIGRADSMI
jgi:hypothetical protein